MFPFFDLKGVNPEYRDKSIRIYNGELPFLIDPLK